MTIGWIKFILKNKNKAHYTILKLQLYNIILYKLNNHNIIFVENI